MRFAELPEAAKHELRSKWARKGARTRRKRIREQRRLAPTPTPVKALTAPPIRVRKLKSGLYSYQRKHYRFEDLPAKVQSYLRSKWSKKAAKSARRKRREASKLAKELAKRIREGQETGPIVETTETPNARNQSALMQRSFEIAKERLETFHPELHSHFLIRETASGAVWGKLAISEFPFNFPMHEFMIDLENWIFVPKNQWLWITLSGHFNTEELEPGASPSESPSENPYRQAGGMDQLPVYPQRPSLGEPYMWVKARDILGYLEEKDVSQPEVIHVNLYWDQLGKKPKMRSPYLKSSYGRTKSGKKGK